MGLNSALLHHPPSQADHSPSSVLLKTPLSLRLQLARGINPSQPPPGTSPSNSPLGRHDWQEYHRRWCHKERGQWRLLDHLSLQWTRLHRQIDLQRFRRPAWPALHTERSLVTIKSGQANRGAQRGLAGSKSKLHTPHLSLVWKVTVCLGK